MIDTSTISDMPGRTLHSSSHRHPQWQSFVVSSVRSSTSFGERVCLAVVISMPYSREAALEPFILSLGSMVCVA